MPLLPIPRRIRTAGRTIAAGTIAAVIAGGAAYAVNGETAPHRYTGCLKTDGTLVKVKAGDAPLSACTTGQIKITLGNGDITGIATGAGLTGAADQGTPTLALAPSYQLPQNCPAGSVPKKSTNFVCGVDYGAIARTVAVGSVDYQGKTSDCTGDLNLPSPIWTYEKPTALDVPVQSVQFQLPTGTYRPEPTGATRWFINRTVDLLDGEQFSKGSVQMQVIRVRSGVETVMSTWARAESTNLDGASLPYNQDFGTFVALTSDVFFIRAWGHTDNCTRARLLDASVDLTRVA